MKKIIPLLTTATLVLAACAPQPPRPTPANMVDCEDNAPPVITIVANKARFSVAPPHLCIGYDPDNDTEIQVNFTGNHAAGVITLEPKSGVDAPWLNVSNPGTNPDKATIKVEAGTAKDTYYYTIKATGWGYIDPMVTVKD